MPKANVLTTLQNSLILATPNLRDSVWESAVIYICVHSDEGTMGVVINQPLTDVNFKEIAKDLSIPQNSQSQDPTIFFGGPVEADRGFVLHDDGYNHETTMCLAPHIHLSSTSDIIREIAQGSAPSNMNLCLGYAGWSAGQLEQEIAENSWLTIDADTDIIYKTQPKKRYAACLQKMGIDPSRVAISFGHA